MIIIFLDFDGVLRRVTAPKYKFEADCLRCFEQTIRTIPDAQIVISSSWRDAFSLSELRSLFSPDVARLIVDVLPADNPRQEYPRHDAILRYLEAAGLNGASWFAIDDCATNFALGCSNLLLVNGNQGLNEKAAEKLQQCKN